MRLMESRIVVVSNMVLIKYLTRFGSLILMGIQIEDKKGLHQGLCPFCP
jgi:hypothetical protein